VAVVASVWACGGSTSTGLDSAASSADGGADGAKGGGTSAYTLDDVCARVGPIVCDLRKPCCEQTGGYDAQGCLAHEAADCANDVNAAREGRETFHPELIDSCAAMLRPLYASSCVVTFDLIYAVQALGPACRIFEGTLAEGAACERDSQCKPGGASDVTSCDATQKVCKTTHFAALGETCTIDAGLPIVCSKGLYCDADLTQKPPSGACKTVTAIGQGCDASKAYNLQCGFGNYCNAGTCAAGKAAGSPCASDLECQSIKCGTDKTCTTPAPLVKPDACNGP
jgi:hypothetical protein